MECSKDCPKLAELAEGMNGMRDKLTTAESLQQANEQARGRNQATAKQLASLPPSKQVAEARSALQEAVVQTAEAQTQIASSINLIHEAIGANLVASEVIKSACPGGPCYVDDPAGSGEKILLCASPGAYEQ